MAEHGNITTLAPLYPPELSTSNGPIINDALQRPRELPAAVTVELREAGQTTWSAADSAHFATVGEGTRPVPVQPA